MERKENDRQPDGIELRRNDISVHIQTVPSSWDMLESHRSTSKDQLSVFQSMSFVYYTYTLRIL